MNTEVKDELPKDNRDFSLASPPFPQPPGRDGPPPSSACAFRPQQRVRRDAQLLAQGQDVRQFREPSPAFPLGNGPITNPQGLRQLPLCQALRLPPLRDKAAYFCLIHLYTTFPANSGPQASITGVVFFASTSASVHTPHFTSPHPSVALPPSPGGNVINLNAKPPCTVIAKPCKGLWQSVSPSKLPSLVLRKPGGISRGPQPPGRWGRIPKGTAFGIGSLWRVFAYFLHAQIYNASATRIKSSDSKRNNS